MTSNFHLNTALWGRNNVLSIDFRVNHANQTGRNKIANHSQLAADATPIQKVHQKLLIVMISLRSNMYPKDVHIYVAIFIAAIINPAADKALRMIRV